MKNKLIDVLYKITIAVFVLVIIIWFILSIINGGIDFRSFFDGIRMLFILPAIFISPLLLFISLVDRIFFHKFNTKNLYKVLIINMIYIVLALTSPDPFSGLNMI